jgi:SAM-dependent methyltransferase
LQVRRNFDKVYRAQDDPWNIGQADSDRYNQYFDLIHRYAKRRRTILDLGCGFGAFLARFRPHFERLVGVEISGDAIRKGRERFPFIAYHQGSAERLEGTAVDAERYDAIIYSDVICYFDEAGKNRSLKWIAEHLEREGLAFIAAWCPGGRYLSYSELERLTERYFKIENRLFLDSRHAVFLARGKRRFIAVTVDYETWHPIPDGMSIDWDKDVFTPTESLLQLCEEQGIPLTLMAEMGEYFWLEANHPPFARRMENQWVDAVHRGHDVQLHLHMNWLPELGARQEGGQWIWDWSKAKANDYPGDLGSLVAKCRATLEAIIRKAKPDYRVTSYRAGAYQAQPFRRLYNALVENGIFCDSSVYAGGISQVRGYDYSLAYSAHQPYFANSYDPQLKAPPVEQYMVEIPVFTFKPNARWFLDGAESSLFAKRLIDFLMEKESDFLSSEAWRRREYMRTAMAGLYGLLEPFRRCLNRVLPRSIMHSITVYRPEKLVGHEYYVLIGHTKGSHDFGGIRRNFRILKNDGRFEFLTLSRMAEEAMCELEGISRRGPSDEAIYQVEREYPVVMGGARNEAQSAYLQRMIPLDRETVLDFGCGAGQWSALIAGTYPWMRVNGCDYGIDFIRRAKERHASKRILFLVGDMLALPFARGSFDCVYADNTLEHAFDVDLAFREIHRVLRWGGVLVAAIPSDANNSDRICDNHVWKTAPHEAKMRLEAAGFTNISIEEIDTFRSLGMPPYPPSNDRMMYIHAWKRRVEVSGMARALEIMDWVYRRLNPEKSQASDDPVEIVKGGYAYCWGYAVVLGKALEREKYSVKWVSMKAKNHPRGRGRDREDTHEVLAVDIDGKEVVLDPMANVLFPHALSDLLADPDRAEEMKNPDERYVAGGYHLYASPFWYRRVVKYAVRKDIRRPVILWKRNK